MINKSIFKSYDIRGIYPSELNESAAYNIGRTFVKYSKAKNIVVGYDARLSSYDLYKALIQGLIEEGAEVTNIGQLPTECLYFAVGNYDFDGGIMITASHNPKEYNGFKMIKKDKGEIVIIRGKDLLPFVNYEKFNSKPEVKVKDIDILDDYLNYISKLINVKDITNFKVIIDASNGVAGNVILKIKLPIEIISLNFRPDGNFPNHSPNPLDTGASNQIKNTIKKESADFGFMFDGDADRIFLVDENGKLVEADLVLLLLAKYFLQKSPSAKIIYNAVCSKAVPEFVKKWGGNPIRTKVGAVNVRDGLLKNEGIVGGEVSAHYSFKDYFYLDSGILAFFIILKIISEDKRKVSEIIKELSIYFKKDMNFEVENPPLPVPPGRDGMGASKEEVIEKLKQKYSNSKQDFLDGLTIEYEDWWFNIRASNTEPLLRLTVEADTEDLLNKKKKELTLFLMSAK